MSEGAELVLELAGVSKRYGSFLALEGIDLQLRRGQVLGFVGPNGAGKTTTLRLITGLLRPSAGQVRVCGFDVERQPLEAKRRIGYISDRPFLYERLTGSEFLRFVAGLFGLPPAQIEESSRHWLERFELTSWAGEPIQAYSHGMRQRLLLCAALLHQPALLVMDEPMVGLDPHGAARLKQTIVELARRQGLAVILSTHTLDVVEQVCDRLAIIDHGRLVAGGTLEEVRRAHQAEQGRLEELFLRLTGSSGPGDSPGPPSTQAREP
jgi:ABC-2 type transport system ATP-binding protein